MKEGKIREIVRFNQYQIIIVRLSLPNVCRLGWEVAKYREYFQRSKPIRELEPGGQPATNMSTGRPAR
jgi:hypothetical protein